MNVLSPGQVDTPDSRRPDKETRQMFEFLIPRGKMGHPEEIATAALFLSSDDFELREWGGVVRRRRLLGHLKSTRLGECMTVKALTKFRQVNKSRLLATRHWGIEKCKTRWFEEPIDHRRSHEKRAGILDSGPCGSQNGCGGQI